jgi:glucose/arabinose dehydrogenase
LIATGDSRFVYDHPKLSQSQTPSRAVRDAMRKGAHFAKQKFADNGEIVWYYHRSDSGLGVEEAAMRLRMRLTRTGVSTVQQANFRRLFPTKTKLNRRKLHTKHLPKGTS